MSTKKLDKDVVAVALIFIAVAALVVGFFFALVHFTICREEPYEVKGSGCESHGSFGS